MKQFLALKENKDFRRLYYKGKQCVKSTVVVYAKRSSGGVCRMGITTSKKIGCAVERNRSRRIIKAAFCDILKDFDLKNWDFVLVARNKTKFKKSTDVKRELIDALKALKVIS